MALTVMPDDVRDRLARAALSYPEPGATAGELPAGYRSIRRRALIGRGHQLFAACGNAVASWHVQLSAGLTVSVSAPGAAPGTLVLLGLGAGSLRVRAPCRVVYAVAEPRRRGFAYGTLPGHPESGEESFIVEHHPDDTVTFTITAFSRPATPLSRLAGPLGRLVQRQVTTRYLRALPP